MRVALIPNGGDVWLPGPDGSTWFMQAMLGPPIQWMSAIETLQWHVREEVNRIHRLMAEVDRMERAQRAIHAKRRRGR